MTWIRIIRPEEADPSLLDLLQKTRALYPPEYAVPVASVEGESIVLSHTLIPKAMHHAFALLAELMRPELPLERRHHEMIATVVSSANRCFF
jgi:hypothetical protein